MVNTSQLVSASQLHLLKAGLLSTEDALQNWQAWVRMHGLDLQASKGPLSHAHITSLTDYESKRLMPLVFQNLRHTNDPIIPHLRDIYRYTRIKNQKHLLQLQKIAGALKEAGIKMLLIKGVPLSLRYYSDLGVRLCKDLDIMVPIESAEHALQILRGLPYNLRVTKYEMKYRPLLHAIHLYDQDGADIDLHWNLLIQHNYFGADNLYWEKSELLKLPNGFEAYTLSPTHQLFHNIVHGCASGWRSPAIRWIADSYVIYKDKKAVNWQELFKLSQCTRMTIPVQQAICLLMSEFDLNLPTEVVQQLNNLPVSKEEVAYFDLINKPASSFLLFGVRYIRKQQLFYNLFQKANTGLPFEKYLQLRIKQSIENRVSTTIYSDFI